MEALTDKKLQDLKLTPSLLCEKIDRNRRRLQLANRRLFDKLGEAASALIDEKEFIYVCLFFLAFYGSSFCSDVMLVFLGTLQ